MLEKEKNGNLNNSLSGVFSLLFSYDCFFSFEISSFVENSLLLYFFSFSRVASCISLSFYNHFTLPLSLSHFLLHVFSLLFVTLYFKQTRRKRIRCFRKTTTHSRINLSVLSRDCFILIFLLLLYTSHFFTSA